MKKVTQPEHAYTGCVPYTPVDDDSDVVPKKRNPPILGYRGHLRNTEDRVGTTFTQGLTVASRVPERGLPRSGAKARAPINQPRQVRFAEDSTHQPIIKAGMSPRSGYGAFDNASGYGAFAAPPSKANMSPRSGYGAFDNASGYGAFAAPPAKVNMSPRSGYGAFDNASGYGAFAAPPGGMSPRSGYGKFDDASGYGNFASPPDLRQGANLSKRDSDHNRRYQRNQDQPTQRGDRVHPVHPSSNQVQELQEHTNRARKVETPSESILHAKYQHAIYRVGGEQAALLLWNSAGQTIWQRYMSRTELLQAVRRSFEKHERTNHGFMTKSQLKEALRDLGCVFTDDQITALFGMYDQHCTGTVPMSDLLLALNGNTLIK